MKKYIVFIAIVIFLFIFIFLLKGEKLFFIGLQPLQKTFYTASKQISATDDFCVEDMQLRIYQAENDVLRKHLNFLESSYDNFVLANVFGQKHEFGSDWFLLDRGKRHGLSLGLAVVDEKGMLIGTIAKIKDSIAYLQPVFDRHSLITADILSEPDSDKESGIVSGIVQGEYGLTIKMKYIPIDKQININDVVVTSGLDEYIRRGIIIGSVAQINRQPNAIFQEIVIHPLFNPDFRIVSILLP